MSNIIPKAPGATATVKTARPKAALRLVKTENLPREEWLDVRKNGIGSSDAAAAVGLNPYKSQLQLWMEKTGRDKSLPVVDPNDEESPMYWGTILEPIVAAHYTRRTGNRVRRINAVLQHPDPDKAWMLANIDREVVGAGDVRIPRKPSTHNDLKPSTCSSRKPSTDNNACRHAHPNGLGSVFFYRIWGSPWRAKPGADFPVQHNSFGCTILLQR